jgi:thiaminase
MNLTHYTKLDYLFLVDFLTLTSTLTSSSSPKLSKQSSGLGLLLALKEPG